MVVRSDDIGDGYGDSNRGDSPSRYPHHPPTIPYYFILTVNNLAPNVSHP